MPHYRPVDAQEIPRYSGIRTFGRLPHVQDLDGVDVAVVGIPFDSATTFAAGTRFGPASVREYSLMLKTYNPALDVQVYDHLSVVDYGDLATVPGYIDDSFNRITSGIRTILDAGVIPVAIGGDHSITLPQLRAFHQVYGPIALLQFDAHPDTWDTYFGQKYTHGTPFRRAIEDIEGSYAIAAVFSATPPRSSPMCCCCSWSWSGSTRCWPRTPGVSSPSLVTIGCS